VRDLVDRLFTEIEGVRAEFGGEEREALAEAIRERSDNVPPKVTPRLRVITEILDEIERSEGIKKRLSWERDVVSELTEPNHDKLPNEMTNDELEREIDRRRRYLR
jgi:hypothetical protein